MLIFSTSVPSWHFLFREERTSISAEGTMELFRAERQGEIWATLSLVELHVGQNVNLGADALAEFSHQNGSQHAKQRVPRGTFGRELR